MERHIHKIASLSHETAMPCHLFIGRLFFQEITCHTPQLLKPAGAEGCWGLEDPAVCHHCTTRRSHTRKWEREWERERAREREREWERERGEREREQLTLSPLSYDLFMLQTLRWDEIIRDKQKWMKRNDSLFLFANVIYWIWTHRKDSLTRLTN